MASLGSPPPKEAGALTVLFFFPFWQYEVEAEPPASALATLTLSYFFQIGSLQVAHAGFKFKTLLLQPPGVLGLCTSATKLARGELPDEMFPMSPFVSWAPALGSRPWRDECRVNN